MAMHKADHSTPVRLAILLLLMGGLAQGRAQSAAEPWPWDDSGAAPAAGEAVDAPPADPFADPMAGEATEGSMEMPADWSGAPDATLEEAPAGADWSFQENEQDLSLMQSGPGEGPDAATSPATMDGTPGIKSGINVGAYEELLRDNVGLRREIAELEQGVHDGLLDKQRLEGELQDMERQLADSVAAIQQLRQGGGAVEADAVELTQVRAERDRLSAEVEALRMQLQAAPPAAAAAGGAPQPGSDLFRALETENARLQQQLRDAGQSVSEAAVAREAKLTSDLAQANAEKAQLQATIDKLVQRVPAMEEELVALRDSVGAKDRDILTKERDLEQLRLEMEKREQRLIKAERMNALLEKTRAEVQQVSKKEQRDLHYNMAAVYSKEGRYREAEQAYLHALRVDPTDAGSHYNLGILYEDVLGDKRKAVMHYRAYLKLAPNAEDVDEVKSWLMQLDMN